MPLESGKGKSKKEKKEIASRNIKELYSANDERVKEGKKPRKRDQIIAIAMKEAGLNKKAKTEAIMAFFESFSKEYPREVEAIKSAFKLCFEDISASTVNSTNTPVKVDDKTGEIKVDATIDPKDAQKTEDIVNATEQLAQTAVKSEAEKKKASEELNKAVTNAVNTLKTT